MARTTTCILCSKQKTPYNFSKHRNTMMKSDFGFCKECLKKIVPDEDVNNAFEMLRLMNIPFVSDVWENAVEISGVADNVFSKYLQLIATKRQYEDFADSVYENEEMYDESGAPFELNDDIIAKWGSRDNNAEYIELEKAYEILVKIKEPSSYLDQQRYIQNIKLSKALDAALESGAKEISTLRKSYAEDLKELGLDVISAQKDEKRSLGQRIAEWEREEPLPSLGKEFDDVDGINNYIRKWFLIPMKRVFGRATEEEISELYEEI